MINFNNLLNIFYNFKRDIYLSKYSKSNKNNIFFIYPLAIYFIYAIIYHLFIKNIIFINFYIKLIIILPIIFIFSYKILITYRNRYKLKKDKKKIKKGMRQFFIYPFRVKRFEIEKVLISIDIFIIFDLLFLLI